MATNLLEMAAGLFNTDFTNRAATTFGEKPENIGNAVRGVIPGIFMGMLDKASTPGGAESIASMAHDYSNDTAFEQPSMLLDTASNGTWMSKGASLLNTLFGNDTQGLVNTVSTQTGMQSRNTQSLLSLIVPAIIGMVGRYMRSHNINAGGLLSLLEGQRGYIQQGLSANVPPVTTTTTHATHTAPVETVRTTESTRTHVVEEPVVTREPRKTSWWPLLLLLLLGGLAWWWWNNRRTVETTEVNTTTDTVRNGAPATTTTTTTTTAMPAGRLDPATDNWVYDAGTVQALDLPDGQKLNVGANTTEVRLVAFLKGNDAVDTVKGNWFEFTNVYFNTGKATITAQSMDQLKNMVAITKAYPNARFKVGGYTDNTGNEKANMTLSQQRAEAVAAELTKLGAAAASITGAEGYGSQHPLADNATAEGRAQNRRVAVRVQSK